MTGLLSASQSQLVLVDYQPRLLPALAGGDAALGRAITLAKAAGLFEVPVIGVEENPAGLGPVPDSVRSLCRLVMPKMAFDACADGLSAHLAPRNERPQVVIAGCEAHVCLMQTALGLRSSGWDVWVVEDACASRAESDRQAAFRRLEAAGARRVTSEMVLFEWLRRADQPQLAGVLRLIK